MSWYATEANTIDIEIQRQVFRSHCPGIEKSRNPSHGTLFASCWIALLNRPAATVEPQQINAIAFIIGLEMDSFIGSQSKQSEYEYSPPTLMLYGWYNLKMPKGSQIVKIPRTTAVASCTTHITCYVFQSSNIIKKTISLHFAWQSAEHKSKEFG